LIEVEPEVAALQSTAPRYGQLPDARLATASLVLVGRVDAITRRIFSEAGTAQ
jgi:hypothetical protein